MRQQLQQEVKAREDMSQVWEQLLEGNARLRREKSMLESVIADTPTRPHKLPHHTSLAHSQREYSDLMSPSSNQHSPQRGMDMDSPGPSASASQHAVSPTLLSGADAVPPLAELRGHGLVDRGYGLSQRSPSHGDGRSNYDAGGDWQNTRG